MNKSFEDELSEFQSSLVALGLEYANDRADEIFLYCSKERNACSFDAFYVIDGTLCFKHKLNESKSKNNSHSYDTSPDRQDGFARAGIDDLIEFIETCKRHQQPIPTEVKILYNVKLNKLDSNINYNMVHSNHPTFTPEDIFDNWFEEIEKTFPRRYAK